VSIRCCRRKTWGRLIICYKVIDKKERYISVAFILDVLESFHDTLEFIDRGGLLWLYPFRRWLIIGLYLGTV
jgi:hypothetical protein